jgi:hypothetical protein
MDWECGSRGRMWALQAQGPEFRPQNQKKKKARSNKCIEKMAVLLEGELVTGMSSQSQCPKT